jgi:hypothetical protein
VSKRLVTIAYLPDGESSTYGVYFGVSNTIYLHPRVKGFHLFRVLYHEHLHFFNSKLPIVLGSRLDALLDIVLDYSCNFHYWNPEVERFTREAEITAMVRH